ncbi:MAG TPA: sulfurtransferase [Spirochaetaceae bacterium]|nr:sulfurtransferase [Spirochaetaceae bacterium]
MTSCDVLILGVGSIGLPLAYYCAQAGLKTIVIEQEASWGRGQNRAAIGGVRATHSDPGKIKICQESIRILSGLERDHGLDVEWRSGGYLFVAYDEARESAFRQLLQTQKAAGLNIDWISPERVRQLSPGIRLDGLRGGTYSPEDGYCSPMMTSTAFHRLAWQAGADFRFNETVQAMRLDGGHIASVQTTQGDYAAGRVVNAAGASSAELASLVNLEIPVHPDAHEAGVTDPVARFMEPMLVDICPDEHSGNYYFYQAVTGQVVFCITPKPQIWSVDTDNTSSFLPLVLKRMTALYPRLRNLKVRRSWRGLYPMTPDGLPIIAEPQEISNLVLAVGMCGQGFMLGPGLGKLLAERLAGRGTEHQDLLDEFTLYRKFEGMELLK